MRMSQWLESLRRQALLACCSALAVTGLMVGNLSAEESKKENSDKSSASSKSDDSTSDDERTSARTSSHDESSEASEHADRSSDQRRSDRDSSADRQQNSRQQYSGRQQGSSRQQGSDQDQQWQRGQRSGSDQNASSNRGSRQQSNWRGQQGQQSYQDQQRRGQQQQQSQQRLDARALGLSLESSDDDDTLRVGRVSSQSPARQAGLREDDTIVSVNGREVSSQRDFDRALTNSQGRRLNIVIDRDGEQRTVQLSTNQFAQNYSNSGRSYSYDDQQQWSNSGEDQQAFLGVVLDDRYQEMAVVRQVYPQSPAAQAGLRPGDTITAINGERVRSPHELSDDVAQLQPGTPIQLQFSRPQSRSVEVRLAARQTSDSQSQTSNQQRQDFRTSRTDNRSQDQDDSDRDSRNQSQDRDDQYDRD